MWVDRYAVEHRRPWHEWARVRTRRLIRGLPDALVTPFETNLDTAFVVGCGHSGTTLLAAKLGRLAGCFLPGWETGAFLPDRGLYWSKAAFGTILRTAEAAGGRVVLEKTPKHVHCAARIRRLLPRAKFLVVVRNPVDTCGSLLQRFGDLQAVIERWNMDNAAALSLLDGPASLLVRYEDLTARAEGTFAQAAAFIGLDWDPAALGPGTTAFSTDSPDRNMALRAAQVARGVHAAAEGWRDRLSAAQSGQIENDTAAIARRLGYGT